MSDYEIRYARNWKEISQFTRQLTHHRCVLCGQRSTLTHHALYRDKQGAIAGREIPGIHIFPLCDRCHSKNYGCAHHCFNWRKDPNYPELGNKNTPQFYEQLRQGWHRYRWEERDPLGILVK